MYSKSQTKPFYIGTKEAPSDCDVPNKGLLSVHEQCTFDKKNVDMVIYLQTHLFNFLINLSSHMRNRTTCIGENKGADQLCSNTAQLISTFVSLHEIITIPLFPKFKISSF